MAGSLDTALRAAAKQVVADLGEALDTSITYNVRKKTIYRVDTSQQYMSITPYTNIKVPIEYVRSEENEGRESRQAKIYIAPGQIGNHQPTIEDEIILNYSGANKKASIIDITTYQGGQTYLYCVLVRF